MQLGRERMARMRLPAHSRRQQAPLSEQPLLDTFLHQPHMPMHTNPCSHWPHLPTAQVMDALNMEFEDNTFDMVWACESGEHMPDKKK
jgi:hypothetical protein